MNTPSIHLFESHQITILQDEHDEPWWIADQVCAALTLAKTDRALAGLDDDEKGTHTVSTPGGPQRKATINEAGLYSLILRCRKPEAKRFKRWITHEILPSIRKTGAYGPTLDPSVATSLANNLAALTEQVAKLALAVQHPPGPIQDHPPHGAPNNNGRWAQYRALYAQGHSQNSIAKSFGVSKYAVRDAVQHQPRTTAHAPAPAPAHQATKDGITEKISPAELERLIRIVRQHLPPAGNLVSNLDIASWIHTPGQPRGRQQLSHEVDTIVDALLQDRTLLFESAWTNRNGRLGMRFFVAAREEDVRH